MRQMIALQCVHYLLLSLVAAVLLRDRSQLSVSLLLDYRISTPPLAPGLHLLPFTPAFLLRIPAPPSPPLPLLHIITALLDVLPLYHLIRRPTHILDFAGTLALIHLIITTYYSGSFPRRYSFYITLAGSVVAQTVLAEQWCVRREMGESFSFDPGAGRPDEIELGKYHGVPAT